MPSHQVILTRHARERMRQRGITKRYIEIALADPDATMPGVQPGTFRIHKRMPDGNTLQVIYKPKPEGALIITAAWRGA